MENILVRLIGYIATIIHGDAAVFDRWRWLRKNLKRGNNIRTLDAGCGSGAFAIYAARVGNDVVGISFDERNNMIATERAKILNVKNIRFMTGDLRAFDVLQRDLGTFDQIICFETIEHIMGDKKLISDLASCMRPHGRLLLTTPYKNYHHFPGDEITPVENGGHVRWGYTHGEMRLLLEGAGFKVVKEDYITGFISQLLIRVERLLVRAHIPSKLVWLVLFPFRIFQVFDRPLTNLMRYPYLCIGVIAVKQ